jgi:hypothetical protein
MLARRFTAEDGPEDGPEGHEVEADDPPAFPLVHPCGWNGSLRVWRGPVRVAGSPMPASVRARLAALRETLAARPAMQPAGQGAGVIMALPFNLPPLPERVSA